MTPGTSHRTVTTARHHRRPASGRRLWVSLVSGLVVAESAMAILGGIAAANTTPVPVVAALAQPDTVERVEVGVPTTTAPKTSFTVTKANPSVVKAYAAIPLPNARVARPVQFAAASLIDIRDAALAHPRIVFNERSRKDVAAGIVDRRVLTALLALADQHTVEVTVLKTGHSLYVKGTRRVSNHIPGRAADIASIDGVPVRKSNEAARAAVEALLKMPVDYRPTELGSPWSPASLPDGEGVDEFTDSGHDDHIHLGFDT